LVEVEDWVMVGVGDIVLHPFTLDNATGVLLVAVILQGIFYCCYMTE